jgi:N-acetyltransferase B complex (NatB) non catalytic subunit
VTTIWKVRKILGLLGFENAQSGNLKKVIRDLHEEYFTVIEVDGKPEKGERKIADELVLLINEILEETSAGSSSQADEWVLYRIGVLEFALERSPYNFDIQLGLAKIYDS